MDLSMLTVRDEQMAAFRDAARRRYEDRMVDYVRGSHAALHARIGEEAVRGLVRHGIDLGRRHGIVTVGGVSVLIDLMARYGRGFEASGAAAWIDAMLARTEVPAEVRIVSIVKHLSATTGGRVIVAAPASETAEKA